MPSTRAKTIRRNRKAHCWSARIDGGDGRPVRRCAVLELSGSGARLAAESFADVPDSFVLLFSACGNVGRACRVRQRAGNELVVRFVSRATWCGKRSDARPAPAGELVFVD
jgi:hypothetical protein